MTVNVKSTHILSYKQIQAETETNITFDTHSTLKLIYNHNLTQKTTNAILVNTFDKLPRKGKIHTTLNHYDML